MRQTELFEMTGKGNVAALGGSSQSFLPRIASPIDLSLAPVAIAVMADLFSVTHRTLHFYEEKGLIRAGRAGSMRFYDASQMRRMAVVTACRTAGIGIAAICDLMEEFAGATSQAEADDIFREALKNRRRELTADMSHGRRQMQQIETLLRAEQQAVSPAPDHPASPTLNERERKCLSLMAEGYSAQRLAQALDLERQELERVESAIIAKFQATNRFQAVAKAMLLGVVLN